MLVQLIGQSYLWDDVIWEVGSVLEVDDDTARYQIGMGRMAAAAEGVPQTRKPEPMVVSPKATPQATGEAIAKALADRLGPSASHEEPKKKGAHEFTPKDEK